MEGKVIAVYGPVVDVVFSGPTELPKISEVLLTNNCEGQQIVFEAVEYFGLNTVRCICFQPIYGLMRGAVVKRTKKPVCVNRAEDVIGRVLDVLGQPIDKKGKLQEIGLHPTKGVQSLPSMSLEASMLEGFQILETGIKIIDLLFPLVKGSKTGIIGGAALGKSLITLEIIHNIVKLHRGACVFCGAGERTREGNELYYEFKKTGVLDKIVMVFGQMNESPAARFEVVNTGIALAESFQRERDDVLFFLDNVYRFVQAGSEISALLGRIPSESGYQPTLSSEVGNFHERICWRGGSSITAVEAVYVPADDITDPAVVAIFAYLDSIIVLSREHVQKGFYPAIDPMQSSSAYLNPQIIGNRHFDVSQEVLRILRRYNELARLVAIIGLDELSEDERQIFERAKRIQSFLTQPFFTAEAYTGRDGQYVTLADTLSGCEKILRGELDKVSEEKLYMIGALD
ncbi:MAG: F0F1 ATP synthase subunit beta [Candidatus Omnitrophota bacterium]